MIERLNSLVWDSGIPVGEESIPFVVIALIGTGVFLTLRLGFIQLRRLSHGFAVTSGRYDDPNEPGDVSHFQALTTALSATVGIGNIAGVAIAIHWGGPGAIFWMWMTALVGMATKYTEVTLAQHYRSSETGETSKMRGTVSGGPMYYIERGLGPRWKPLAILFATLLGITAFFTGNAIQANTVADVMQTEFGVAEWITGLITASIVAMVIIGGITRIGRVTGVLAPLMATIYVLGGFYIILSNFGSIVPTFSLIVREAFNPTAGVAGTGVGVFLVTMMWGVRRGLFSNEAGQGSAPIAHAAAKTDEPVSEGVVALVEPFIDTLVICTVTAMVILMTGAWEERVPTRMVIAGGDVSYVAEQENGRVTASVPPNEIRVVDGYPQQTNGDPRLAWHDVAVERFFVDAEQTRPFEGIIQPLTGQAIAVDGTRHAALHGNGVRTGAPLTMLGFRHGLPGQGGRFIVIVSVLLFAISTTISWSYYGDRCANYLFGPKAILPYKFAFIAMHFVGAVLALADIWSLGDVFLGMVILPNLLAMILLSPKVIELTKGYFQRKPWKENYAVHRKIVEERRHRHRDDE